jgi:hypothetical protein
MLTGALAMFGQIFDGAFGYSVDAGVFGAAFLMAATRPSYPKVTRFIGGLGAVACATSGALDGLLATFRFANTYSRAPNMCTTSVKNCQIAYRHNSITVGV